MMIQRPEGLEIECNRLQNAIFHLLRTNAELEGEMKENGHDHILREAIGENIVVIAKYRGQIQRLEQEIRIARGLTTDYTLNQESSVTVRDTQMQTENDEEEGNVDENNNTDSNKRNGLWL